VSDQQIDQASFTRSSTAIAVACTSAASPTCGQTPQGRCVDAICAGAGVSKGAFYLHFKRKEDLLLEYGLGRLRRIREMVPGLIAKSFRDAVEAILDEVVRGKEWGREVAARALLEMGTNWEGLARPKTVPTDAVSLQCCAISGGTRPSKPL